TYLLTAFSRRSGVIGRRWPTVCPLNATGTRVRNPQRLRSAAGTQIGAEETAVTAIQDLVERNSFRAGTGPGPMASAPSLHIAVVACMDARLDPVQLLGLRPGEAHVIRNAGGVVTDDVVRSLAVSQRKLGTTEVMLLHHTRCGMATFTD